MELIDLIPNSMSFRVVTTLEITDESQIPLDFTGRVKHHENGSVLYVAWYQDGQLHNPGKHHPAYRRFRSDGRLKYEMFYTHGLLHDPSDSVPAVRGFYADGKVHYEERYFGGKRHDGREGSAAIRKWRNDGALRHEIRYQHGKRLLENGATSSPPPSPRRNPRPAAD
jgi:antitoxin component YwqK of YwqJK toxin-antitoxin module